VSVALREVDDTNRDAVLALRVTAEQQAFVVSVAASLAEVEADEALTAYAVHDTTPRTPSGPDRPIGFAVTEVRDGVGFVLRLLVDAGEQGRGLGLDLLVRLVEVLRARPDVEMVATSHRHDNVVMAGLCRSLGFVPWETPWPPPDGEVYLRLPEG
jgi:diamine N-acetyltransferase